MTQQKINFKATPRTVKGKKVKQLRRQGITPGNVMGHKVDSVPVSVSTTGFNHLYNQVGDTGLFYLEIDGEDVVRPVLIEDVEVNPVSNQPLHVTFKQVNLKEKITAEIPVELVGEFKTAGAVVITVHDAIEVEALPTDLPEKFEIDISGLSEIGQAVTFDQLTYDREKITLMINEEEHDTPVVLVQEVKEEPVEEVVTEEAAEGETPAEGAAEGSESGAETPKAESAE